jgi:hypothetical protein
MGKHTDVVTFRRDESPFDDELPVPGYIHRVPRPGAPGGVATMIIDAVEVVGDAITATVTTYEGPLCPVPCAGIVEGVATEQAELFPTASGDDTRRSHPSGRTATLPRRA